jgi:hypothetical protein
MALEANSNHPVGLGDRLLAPLCLTLAAQLVPRLGFARVVALARWNARTGRRSATASEAASITTALGEAARHRSGRIACLERSLAAVLLAGLRRRRVTWCIGARLMPYGSHAWIEVDGQPIGEAFSDDRPYQVLLRV